MCHQQGTAGCDTSPSCLTTETCSCNPGYVGENCEILCSNGSFDGATCVCEAGWTGSSCDVNINKCDPNPCVNGACIDGTNSYSCACLPGWSGTSCNIADGICPLPIGTYPELDSGLQAVRAETTVYCDPDDYIDLLNPYIATLYAYNVNNHVAVFPFTIGGDAVDGNPNGPLCSYHETVDGIQYYKDGYDQGLTQPRECILKVVVDPSFTEPQLIGYGGCTCCNLWEYHLFLIVPSCL